MEKNVMINQEAHRTTSIDRMPVTHDRPHIWKKIKIPVLSGTGGDQHFYHTTTIMASPSATFPDIPGTPGIVEVREESQPGISTIPPIRWIMVGYFVWVGIFLGALIMHAATSY
jgi:hypothetical protein